MVARLLSGLCGDYDGVKGDDLRLADDTGSDDLNAIGDSYTMNSLPPVPDN